MRVISTEMCFMTQAENRLHTLVGLKNNERITNISNKMFYRNVKEFVGNKSSDRSPENI
jgi:hypothetical protein